MDRVQTGWPHCEESCCVSCSKGRRQLRACHRHVYIFSFEMPQTLCFIFFFNFILFKVIGKKSIKEEEGNINQFQGPGAKAHPLSTVFL